jgi:hypothetical protein
MIDMKRTDERRLRLPAVLLLALIVALLVATPARAAGWSVEFSLAQWHHAVHDSSYETSLTSMNQYVTGFRDAYAWAQTEILRIGGGSIEDQDALFRRATNHTASELLTAALAYHPDETPSVALQKTLDYLVWEIE